MVIQFGKEPDPGIRIRKAQGKEIRRIRTMRGIEVHEFATAVGVTDGAVSQWETGRYTPRPHIQVKIARVLDVPWSIVFSLDREVA
jgi:transcriptional regulator with XRE-family HTH domain